MHWWNVDVDVAVAVMLMLLISFFSSVCEATKHTRKRGTKSATYEYNNLKVLLNLNTTWAFFDNPLINHRVRFHQYTNTLVFVHFLYAFMIFENKKRKKYFVNEKWNHLILKGSDPVDSTNCDSTTFNDIALNEKAIWFKTMFCIVHPCSSLLLSILILIIFHWTVNLWLHSKYCSFVLWFAVAFSIFCWHCIDWQFEVSSRCARNGREWFSICIS